jgi:nitrite reductase/ring-hydroxylating ferredoxin subunit
MHHLEQRALTRRLLDLKKARRNENHGQAIAISSSTYLDPDRHEAERELIAHSPMLVGLTQDIPEPGDFVTRDYGGLPILATRLSDGSVRAFANICRHRAAKLVGSCNGRATKFSCPFHGWTYGADGELLALPDPTGFEDIDKDAIALQRLPVIERDGMIWLFAKGGSDLELAEFADGFSPDLASYDLAGAHHFETVEIDGAYNWKLGLDTFLEAYHFSSLHRDSIARVFVGNLTTFDAWPSMTRGVIARHSIDQLDDFAESDGLLLPHCAAIYVAMPGTLFFWQGDHYEIWRVFPGDTPATSKLYFSLYAPQPIDSEKARAHWRANVDLAMSVINAEDFLMARQIQHNLDSGLTHETRFGSNEAGLIYYHSWLNAKLTGVPFKAPF